MSRITTASIIGLIVLTLAAATVTGCVGAKSSAKPIYYYTLEDEALAFTFGSVLPHVVRVERFTATPPFDGQRIIYADKGLHRNAYTHFKWIAPPGDMLAFALARELQQTGSFQAVLPPGAGTPPTHTIHGWIETFLEEDAPEPAQATLSVTIALIDTREADPVTRILFQKSYAASSPCDERTPAALSKAMSRSVASVSKQIITDVYAFLAERQR